MEQAENEQQVQVEVSAGAVVAEQPVADKTQKRSDDILAAGATDSENESTAKETVTEEFAERAFTTEKDDRVQSSAGERAFIAGVGFVEVSHPK